MVPADVKPNNGEEVRLSTYFAQNRNKRKQQETLKRRPFKFKMNQYVRISHLKGPLPAHMIIHTQAKYLKYSGGTTEEVCILIGLKTARGVY